jgi:serine/threonine protein kinase
MKDKTAALGTPLDMAPELFSEEGKYDREVNVCAFAITYYRFFAAPMTLDDHSRPFRDTAQLFRRIQKGARFARLPLERHRAALEAGADRPTFADLIEDSEVIRPIASPA